MMLFVSNDFFRSEVLGRQGGFIARRRYGSVHVATVIRST